MDKRRVRVEELAPGDEIVASKDRNMVGATVLTCAQSMGHYYRVAYRGGFNLNAVVGFDSHEYVLEGTQFTVR